MDEHPVNATKLLFELQDNAPRPINHVYKTLKILIRTFFVFPILSVLTYVNN